MAADSAPKKTPYGYTISYETTRYTGPVGKDGGLDFIAAMNREFSDGVTRRNNLAIDLTEIVGADVFITEKIRQQVVEYLRPTELPPSKRFVDLEQFYARVDAGEISVDADGVKRPKYIPDELHGEPWSASEHPYIAAWLKANEAPLDALVAAAKTKNRFYTPMIAGDENQTCISVLLPSFTKIRQLCRMLSARAMLRYANNENAKALDDLLTIIRIARAMHNSGMLINELVSNAIEALADKTLKSIIVENKLTAAELAELQVQLNSIRKRGHIAGAIECERFFIIGTIADIARIGPSNCGDMAEYIGGSPEEAKVFNFPASKIDWDVPMRMANEVFDRQMEIVRAKPADIEKLAPEFSASISEGMQRILFKLTEIEEKEKLRLMGLAITDPAKYQKEMEKLGALAIDKWLELLDKEGAAAQQIRSEIAGEYIISLLMPSMTRAAMLYHRIHAGEKLTQLSVALAMYNKRSGSWPTELKQLSQLGISTDQLTDPLSGKEFIYKPSNDASGYVLYSVGDNLKDDGGNADDNQDIVISVGK